jgi:hypothetical protein
MSFVSGKFLVACFKNEVTSNILRLIKQAALRRKSKDWLARNQNNVSEWSDCYFSERAL